MVREGSHEGSERMDVKMRDEGEKYFSGRYNLILDGYSVIN